MATALDFETITHETLVAGLRAMADWYEAHPDVPVPAIEVRANVFVGSKEDMAALARLLGGVRKNAAGDWFYLEKHFGGGVQVDFNLPRAEACIRRVVGTREVAETVVPAHTEEIVEWDCQPILGESGQ